MAPTMYDTVNGQFDWRCVCKASVYYSQQCQQYVSVACMMLTPLSREGSARASVGVTPNWLKAAVKAALVGEKTVATRIGSLRYVVRLAACNNNMPEHLMQTMMLHSGNRFLVYLRLSLQ